MTILLTGATGFLGSHLLKGLLQKADYSVVVLKRSSSNLSRIKDFISDSRVRLVDVDGGDLLAVREVMQKGDVSAVIHCATEYGRGKLPISKILAANLIFPIGLLDLCVEFNVGVFINTDSYFNKPKTSYPYLLDYSLSKKSLLLWLPYFAEKMKIANMTLEHIYGPLDGENKFVYQMVKRIAKDRESSIDLSPGEQLRDFVYVNDVVSAYIHVLRYLLSLERPVLLNYDVGRGAAVSIREFVECIKDISQSNSHLNFGALPYRDKEIMESKADISALEEIGWHSEYDYRAGLKDLLKSEV